MAPNVILVDDDEDLVVVTKMLLEAKGIQVAGVGYDGEDAFQLYQKHKPDVVLLDYNMPKYNGLYAFNKIRKSFPNSKFCMITGNSDIVSNLFADYNGYEIVKKPFNATSLAETIRKISMENPSEII